MSSTPDALPPLVEYQLRENGEAIKSLRSWRGRTEVKIATIEERQVAMADDVKSALEQLSGIRKLLWGLMSSILIATVTFALSLLVATGRL